MLPRDSKPVKPGCSYKVSAVNKSSRPFGPPSRPNARQQRLLASLNLVAAERLLAVWRHLGLIGPDESGASDE
jgi:hypothetical protein